MFSDVTARTGLELTALGFAMRVPVMTISSRAVSWASAGPAARLAVRSRQGGERRAMNLLLDECHTLTLRVVGRSGS